MKTVIQTITVILGFLLIFGATAAHSSTAVYRVDWKAAGVDKLSTDVVLNDQVVNKPDTDSQDLQVGWEESLKKIKCKIKGKVALDDFSGQTQNKMRAMTTMEWQF